MMKEKKCPSCKRKGIDLFMGFTTGNYLCKKCGYIGPVVIEEDKAAKKKPKKKKAKKK